MNNNTSHQNALHGTKTADNLMHAFEKEATAALRSDIYSQLARQGNDVSTRRMLDEMRENGTSQGELWLGYLDEIEDTTQNLSYLSDIKRDMDSSMYNDMALVAEDEGFPEIAEKFRMAATVQNNHSARLDDRVSQMNGTKTWDANTMHTCAVCGYTITGNNHPEICPLCVREWI